MTKNDVQVMSSSKRTERQPVRISSKGFDSNDCEDAGTRMPVKTAGDTDENKATATVERNPEHSLENQARQSPRKRKSNDSDKVGQSPECSQTVSQEITTNGISTEEVKSSLAEAAATVLKAADETTARAELNKEKREQSVEKSPRKRTKNEQVLESPQRSENISHDITGEGNSEEVESNMMEVAKTVVKRRRKKKILGGSNTELRKSMRECVRSKGSKI